MPFLKSQQHYPLYVYTLDTLRSISETAVTLIVIVIYTFLKKVSFHQVRYSSNKK